MSDAAYFSETTCKKDATFYVSESKATFLHRCEKFFKSCSVLFTAGEMLRYSGRTNFRELLIFRETCFAAAIRNKLHEIQGYLV